ncbi:hypothetical protein AF72_03100 [Xylella taiwanensis]|uniref:Uncharacterized protein n=1 Tax=Xylella taiwanensis TaxID=1444770 RepID=Z9JMC2_9GAMM|nr:hypothetical protein AF72_03100 [Xylella taiwanensis]
MNYEETIENKIEFREGYDGFTCYITVNIVFTWLGLLCAANGVWDCCLDVTSIMY